MSDEQIIDALIHKLVIIRSVYLGRSFCRVCPLPNKSWANNGGAGVYSLYLEVGAARRVSGSDTSSGRSRERGHRRQLALSQSQQSAKLGDSSDHLADYLVQNFYVSVIIGRNSTFVSYQTKTFFVCQNALTFSFNTLQFYDIEWQLVLYL